MTLDINYLIDFSCNYTTWDCDDDVDNNCSISSKLKQNSLI